MGSFKESKTMQMLNALKKKKGEKEPS